MSTIITDPQGTRWRVVGRTPGRNRKSRQSAGARLAQALCRQAGCNPWHVLRLVSRIGKCTVPGWAPWRLEAQRMQSRIRGIGE